MRIVTHLTTLSLVAIVSALNLCALDFSPAPTYPQNNTFGALSIGWAHSNIVSAKADSTAMGDYKSARNAVLFGLKRGFALGDSRTILLNAWIDGSAGSESKNGLYAFSLGGQVGYRFFSGRVIGLVGGGFEMSNLAITQTDEQYNIYGGLVSAELFFDIARGYGISVGYKHGFNYQSKKLPAERFNTSGIIVAFSFYDFSI